jgi:hypothetical protein
MRTKSYLSYLNATKMYRIHHLVPTDTSKEHCGGKNFGKMDWRIEDVSE